MASLTLKKLDPVLLERLREQAKKSNLSLNAFIRQLLTRFVGLEPGMETYTDRYMSSVGAFNDTDLMRLIQVASETSFQVKRSGNPKLLLEMAMIKMIKMDRSVELKTLLSNLGGAAASPNVSATASTQSTNAPSAQAVPVAPVPQIKQDMTQPVASVSPETAP